MINKHNVCLFIKDEEHLEQMREFLESKMQIISKGVWFSLDEDKSLNYLQFGLESKNWWLASKTGNVVVTTEQFKNLWE